jgi:hypothetical protein
MKIDTALNKIAEKSKRPGYREVIFWKHHLRKIFILEKSAVKN